MSPGSLNDALKNFNNKSHKDFCLISLAYKNKEIVEVLIPLQKNQIYIYMSNQ